VRCYLNRSNEKSYQTRCTTIRPKRAILIFSEIKLIRELTSTLVDSQKISLPTECNQFEIIVTATGISTNLSTITN
jgi:hypothetical protein